MNTYTNSVNEKIFVRRECEIFFSHGQQPEVNFPQARRVSQSFKLIISNREKILSNINVVAWRQVKRESNSLPVAVRGSKMSRSWAPNYINLVLSTHFLCKGTTSSIQFNVTCDDYLTVYVDGKLLGEGNTDIAVKGFRQYEIQPGSQVVALKCKGKPPPWEKAILGSLGNGLVTDNSWKCTNSVSLGWNMRNYQDDSWPMAASHGPNSVQTFPWGEFDSIDSNALWIWTNDYVNDLEVYCRRNIVLPCTKGKLRVHSQLMVFIWCHGGHVDVQNNAVKCLLGIWLYCYAKLVGSFSLVFHINMVVSSRGCKLRINSLQAVQTNSWNNEANENESNDKDYLII